MKEDELSDAAASAVSTAKTSAPGSQILDLREANETLVMAILRTQEQADLAESARAAAESMADLLRERERELLATAELRERLMGIVGHDLRNPLSAISMCAQLMVSEGNYDRESIATLVSFLLTSVHRMDRMIKQLSQFTRARLGGGIPFEPEAANLRPICQHAIEELTLTSSIPIRATYEGELSGFWDSERLMEALSNLLSNAIDHATVGTVVSVFALDQGKDVQIEVSNQGAPIPAELLPVLFAPFCRSRPGIKARDGHLGLGLFIAHEIVHSHGGTLAARSGEGTTTFAITLPRGMKPVKP